MRRIAWIFVVLLGIGSSAAAQTTSEPKRWDVSGSAALFEARPGQNDTLYQDNWYFHGRYAVTVGHYWTQHLKTEVEYAQSGEGSIFLQDFKRIDGLVYPYSIESLHRLEQGSVRMVWQFGENTWVHPYVSAGITGDRERQRVHTDEQYQYASGRPNNRLLVVRDSTSGPTWEYGISSTAAAGAKFYMSRNAFLNTGVVGTWSKPAATVSLFAGFGIDF